MKSGDGSPMSLCRRWRPQRSIGSADMWYRCVAGWWNLLHVLWMLLLLAIMIEPARALQSPAGVEADFPRLHLIETLRLGALDGPPEEVFGRIVALAVTENGSVWVADGQVPVIRRFNSDGQYLGDVGREGSGPGEYRYIGGLEPYPGGRMALYDPRNARVSIYDTTGAFETSIPVQAGLYEREIFATDTTGVLLVKARSRRERRSDAAWEKVWIRISPHGEVLDSIEIPPEPTAGFVIATASGYRAPFPAGVVSAWSPLGYLVTGQNEEYVLRMITPAGESWSFRIDYDPVAVTGAEKDMWERWARHMSRRGPLQGFQKVPDQKPAFRSLIVDIDGRIWVDRYAAAKRRPIPDDTQAEAPPFDWRQDPTWDVVTPDGRFLGQVVFPAGMGPWFASGNNIWSVVKGEFDEPYVVRLRMDRSHEGRD